MINFANATFVKSCPNRNEKPQDTKTEVLIVGRSNVGKSSLINALTAHKRLAYTSRKPGHTRLLNYYDIDTRFYLVDAPGYGYAQGGINLDQLFNEMMTSYFSDNQELKLVLVLLDGRRNITDDDQEIIDYLLVNHIPFYLVITKTDKLNQSEKSALNKHLRASNIAAEQTFYTSALVAKSLVPLQKAIENNL